MLDGGASSHIPAGAVTEGRSRDHESPVVAILAGGAGERLGGSKPLVELLGRPLLSYPLAAARSAGLDVVVVAKPSTPLPPLGEPVLREPAEPRHPLVGVLIALEFAAGRPVVALACDMPLLTPALLSWLASLDGAAYAVAAGRPQPLLARYLHSAVPALERALRERRPLVATLSELDARALDEGSLRRFGDPERLCFNVNAPADLALAERWLREQRHGVGRERMD